jgi:hypothetical protein
MNCILTNSSVSNSSSSYFCKDKINNQSAIIRNPIDSSDIKCCYNKVTESSSVLIITLISVIGLLILSIAAFCYWKYVRLNKLSYDDLKKFDDFDVSRIRT